MRYFGTLLILLTGMYTYSYGIYQWKHENNKLGAFGTIMFTAFGTVLPGILYFMRY